TAVLARHGVIVLQGPAHHPRFYGQLERQNREHSAWVHVANDQDDMPFGARIEDMQTALNVRWRRRALDWKTPLEVWQTRSQLHVDRDELQAQVAAHAHNLRAAASHDNMSEDLARRLAIEHVLTNLGYLRIEIRRQVLGDKELLKEAI